MIGGLHNTPVALPVLVGLAFAYKSRDATRAPKDLALRALCRTLLALTLATAVSTAQVAAWLDRVVGIRAISEALASALVLVAAYFARELMDRLTAPHRLTQRRVLAQSALLVVALALLASLKLVASADYWQVAYLCYLGLIQVDVPALALRYGRLGSDRLLRLGIRLVGVGSVCGMIHAGSEGLALLAEHTGHGELEVMLRAVSGAAFVIALLLALAGATIPSAGSALLELLTWVRRRSAYRRLYPLWRALYEAEPAIALDPPRSAITDLLTVRDLDLRLYRRVIEIRDGVLALRPYQPQDIELSACNLVVAEGLRGRDLDAAVEAIAIEAARRAKMNGHPLGQHEAAVPIGWSGFDEECDWLQTVSRAYASKLTAQAVRTLGSEDKARERSA